MNAMKHASRFSFRSVIGFASAAAMSSLIFAACQSSSTDLNMPQLPQEPLSIPAGFPKPVIPADNPVTPAKVQLGRQLFYDVKLSRDNSTSCASCHSLTASFSDPGKAVSFGVSHRQGSRNAPALMNVAYDTTFFWDGRAGTLELQALGPILNPVELANDSNTVIARLKADAFYLRMFQEAFPDGNITFQRIGQAIATFERTLISGASPYDRYMQGDKSAISPAAQRGLKLFNDTTDLKTNCVSCHSGVNFTDNSYRSTGLDEFYSDQGRGLISGSSQDFGKFRVPSLRNIFLTAPYMHDGRFTNLTPVLQHYNEGGKHNSTQDPLVHQLNLTDAQLSDITEFLKSLTDDHFTNNKAFANPNN